ncbi:MAG TPA: phage portal protein [Herpetosiphonaceae bacterium]
MSSGTASWFSRVGATFAALDSAFKARPPAPGELYPARSGVPTSYMSFPGWDVLEARGNTNSQDEQRAKTAIRSPWVYSDLQAIANEASAAELVVKERQGKKLEDVENHNLELLWESPNPHMGRSYLISFWCWSYVLASKSYLYWMPGDGGIAELWPIPPFMMSALPDAKDLVRGYAFKSRPDADPIIIPPEYITFSRSVNIFDVRDGLSFLAAAHLGIETDLAAAEWNRSFFREQNAVPDGLITIPRDTLDGDLARVRQEIRDFFGGTRRGVAVARAGDMDYKPFGRTQKDAEFLAGRQFSEKEIDRTLGFPQGYWSERANRANAEQARATMIAGAVWPLLVRLAEDINAQTMPRWWGEQYRAEFKDIRPEDRELKLRELEFYAKIETIDQLRERVGDEPIGDVRGLMLISELEKGTPIPTSEPSLLMEDEIAAMEEEAAAEMPEEPIADEVPPEDAPIEEVPPDATEELKAIDLDRWERKVIKAVRAGKSAAAVKFESAAIPKDEQQRIRQALGEAHDAAAVRAAFTAVEIKTAKLTPQEQALLDEVETILKRFSGRLVDAVIDGDTPDLTDLESALKAAILPALVDAVVSGVALQVDAVGVAMDGAQAAALAQEWAASYVPGAVGGMTGTTRDALIKAITTYRATSGMTRQQVAQLLAPYFGAAKADVIATTEITRANAQAAKVYNDYLKEQGLDYEFIWQTNNDERVCPKCAPKNGQVTDADTLPPGHPRCRCGVTQRRKRD